MNENVWKEAFSTFYVSTDSANSAFYKLYDAVTNIKNQGGLESVNEDFETLINEIAVIRKKIRTDYIDLSSLSKKSAEVVINFTPATFDDFSKYLKNRGMFFYENNKFIEKIIINAFIMIRYYFDKQ